VLARPLLVAAKNWVGWYARCSNVLPIGSRRHYWRHSRGPSVDHGSYEGLKTVAEEKADMSLICEGEVFAAA
jgi:hypothetical protein